MMHENLSRLLKQTGDDFQMSSEIPHGVLRRIALRRLVAAGTVGFVVLVAGAGAVLAIDAFGERTSGPPPADNEVEMESDVPDMARVECTSKGASAVTPRVRPRRDGVHIVIDNQTDKRAFYIRDLDLVEGNHGGKLQPNALEEVVTTFPPGEILVGCFENDRSTPYSEVAGQGFARLTIVDPEGMWVPAEPACPVPERIQWDTEARSTGGSYQEHELIARTHFDLDDQDDFLPAGYPQTPWKLGPTYSVIRADEAIAIISFSYGDSSAMTVQTCEEGGLEPGPDDDPQSASDPSSWTIYYDSEQGFSIGYPETWYRARESLTPLLGEPTEIVSLGTFDLVYREGECAHMPSSALEDLGPEDAFVSLQEGGGKDLEAYPPRPEDLEESAQPTEGFMCTPPGVEPYWLRFRDSGRAFYALLVLGADVAPETRAEAWAVLNSFDPEPREP